MKNMEKMKMLYAKANQLNEENPLQLQEKLSIYGQLLEIIGGFYATAVRDWKKAEATRRETLASAFIYGAEIEGVEKAKTDKGKEAIAEMASAKARQDEADAEGDAIKWKNAFISVQEQIQIMKKRYDNLKEVNRGGV